MVLLIDNYDSFSFNLYQLVGSIDPDIKVIRSDELTVEEIRALKPDYVILSPDLVDQLMRAYTKTYCANAKANFQSSAYALVTKPSAKYSVAPFPTQNKLCTANKA